MTMRATAFWTDRVYVEHGEVPSPTLRIYPEGQHQGAEIDILFRTRVTPDQQLAIADEMLAGVQAWRDLVAARAEQERTATDELAAARAEIARLKAVS